MPWDEDHYDFEPENCVPVRGYGAFMSEQDAIDFFGITEYPPAAGFILDDGQMLDLSEGQGDQRYADHRQVVCRTSEKEGARSIVMGKFCEKLRAIRFHMNQSSSAVKVVERKLVPFDEGKVEIFEIDAGRIPFIEHNGDVAEWFENDYEWQDSCLP